MRELSQKTRRLLLAGVVIVGLLGCSDNSKLSRDRAKEVIQSAQVFALALRNENLDSLETMDLSNELKKLKQAGMINYSVIRQGVLANTYGVNLTFAGKAYIVRGNPETNKIDPNGSVVMLKLCDRTIQEITGIKQTEGTGKAEVNFTYRAENVTPFGAVSSKCPEKSTDGVAGLALFDDGWRLEGFRLK